MLNIKMEFIRGILFCRLDGALVTKNIPVFENSIIPIVLNQGIKYIVINLEKVNVIDMKGIESLMKLNYITFNNKGKITLCSLINNQVKKALHEYNENYDFYETEDELSALGVIKL